VLENGYVPSAEVLEGSVAGYKAHAVRMLNYYRSEAENIFAWALIEFFDISLIAIFAIILSVLSAWYASLARSEA